MKPPRISITIPTHNRCEKLRRTVRLFANEVLRAGVEKDVEILISDNCSPDDTPDVASSLVREFPQVAIRCQRHQQNIGASANFVSCYNGARGDFVWLFSDDDIPFPGCLTRILAALAEHSPCALLFSFVQPPKSKLKTFDFPESVHLERDPEKCAKLLVFYLKISIYVLKRIPLDDASIAHLLELQRIAPAYGWAALGIEVFAAAPQSPVAVISEPLAGCDDEFITSLNWEPFNWKAEATVFDHPFLKANAPALYRDREKWTYSMALFFFWSWRSGSMTIKKPLEPLWWQALSQFPCKWGWVFPGFYGPIQLLALKFGPQNLPWLLVQFRRWLKSFRKGQTAI